MHQISNPSVIYFKTNRFIVLPSLTISKLCLAQEILVFIVYYTLITKSNA